jgi:hypothetical protein
MKIRPSLETCPSVVFMHNPLLLALAFLLTARCAYSQLNWSNRQIDLKPKALDESIDTAFEFKNAGTTPITIREIKPSCGCTTAALAKKTYAPGESGKIDVSFKIGERMGFQQKQIMVSTDSVDEPLTQLTLRVDIPELIRMEPKAIAWPVNSEPVTRTIKITTGTDQPVRVLGVRSSDSRLFAELRQVAPGKAYEVVITTKSTSEPLHGSIRVETDFPPEHPRSYTVIADVHPPFVPPAQRAFPQPVSPPLPSANGSENVSIGRTDANPSSTRAPVPPPAVRSTSTPPFPVPPASPKESSESGVPSTPLPESGTPIAKIPASAPEKNPPSASKASSSRASTPSRRGSAARK